MDTNVSKALLIVGGLLIAVIVISALTYFYGLLTPLKQNEVDIKAMEQLSKFNKEFEIYNKELMYGTNVLSALNKAANYNKKYVEEYSNADYYDLYGNYLININLTIKNDVVHSVEARKIDKNIEKPISITEIENFTYRQIYIKNQIKCSDNDLLMYDNKIFLPQSSVPYTLLDKNKLGQFYMCDELYDLVNSSNELKRIAKNIYGAPDVGVDVWSEVIYYTPAYDFKSRKFKCTGVEYSKTTGRIIELNFEEIDI